MSLDRLRGDFDRDGSVDVAVFVWRPSNGKCGVILFRRGGAVRTIIGAGIRFGDADDDLCWVSDWKVVRDRRHPIIYLQGEDTDDRIIWDGRRFRPMIRDR